MRHFAQLSLAAMLFVGAVSTALAEEAKQMTADGEPWHVQQVARSAHERPAKADASPNEAGNFLHVRLDVTRPEVSSKLHSFRIINAKGEQVGGEPSYMRATSRLVFEGNWDSLAGLYLEGLDHREPLFEVRQVEPLVERRAPADEPVTIARRDRDVYIDRPDRYVEDRVVVDRPDRYVVRDRVVRDDVVRDDVVVHDRRDRVVVHDDHDTVRHIYRDGGDRVVHHGSGGSVRHIYHDDGPREIHHHRGGSGGGVKHIYHHGEGGGSSEQTVIHHHGSGNGGGSGTNVKHVYHDGAGSGSGSGSGSGMGSGSGGCPDGNCPSEGQGQSPGDMMAQAQGMGPGQGQGMAPGQGQGQGEGCGCPSEGQGQSPGDMMAQAQGMGPGQGQGMGQGMAPGQGQGPGQGGDCGCPPGEGQSPGEMMAQGQGPGQGPGMGPGQGPGSGPGNAMAGGPGTIGPKTIGPKMIGPRVIRPDVDVDTPTYRDPRVFVDPRVRFDPRLLYNPNLRPGQPGYGGPGGQGGPGAYDELARAGLKPEMPKPEAAPAFVLYVSAGEEGGAGKVYQVNEHGRVLGWVNLPFTPSGLALHREHGLVASLPRDGGRLMHIDDTGKVSTLIDKDKNMVHPVDVALAGGSDSIVVADNMADVLMTTSTGGINPEVYRRFDGQKWTAQDMSIAVTRDGHVIMGSNGNKGIHRFSGDKSQSASQPVLPEPGGVAADPKSLRWAATQAPNEIFIFEGEELMKKLRLPPGKAHYRGGKLSFGPAGTICGVARPEDQVTGEPWFMMYDIEEEKVRSLFPWDKETMTDFVVGPRMFWERNDPSGYKSRY